MRRSIVMVGIGALLTACPSEPAVPPVDTSESATSGSATGAPSDGSDATETAAETETDSGVIEPWLEVGWGVSEFNEFDGLLPTVVGPQGLAMFSIPLRGQGFYNPPSPSFDNPDMPMLQAWVDVPGYSITPTGHFNEVIDYPALFYPSLDEPGILEGPAVWLVIPDQVEPEEIAGLDAHLHVEMLDANDILLTEDYDLVIGDAPEPPPGP